MVLMPFKEQFRVLIGGREDGNLFHLRRLQAITKVKETTPLFAEDRPLNAGSGPEIQVSMDKFFIACCNFGFTIKIQKAKLCTSLLLMDYTQSAKSQSKGRKCRQLTNLIILVISFPEQ